MHPKTSRDPRQETALPEIRRAPLSEKYVLMYLIGAYEEVIDEVVAILPTWEYFGETKHQYIYKRILELHNAGQYVSLETMTPGHAELYTFGDLADLFTTDFSPAEIFPERHVKQRVITNARIVSECYHRQLVANSVDDAEITTLSDYIERMKAIGADRRLNIHQITAAALERLDEEEVEKIPYPYPLFTSALGGIEQGSYTIVAARPSTGKSVMIQDFILTAVRAGKRVLFLSAEMPQVMLEHRLLCSVLQRNLTDLKRLWQPERYAELVVQGLAELDKLAGLDIVFSNRVSVVEEELRKGGYDLVVIDYLQMLEPKRSNYRGDYEKVTAVSGELVAMARAYNTAFVVAAQFNREGQEKQPSMAEIKGSGQIEQDADIIFSLWRDEEDTAPPGCRLVRVDVLKNRNGAIWHNSKAKRFGLLMEEGIYRFKSLPVSSRTE